MTQFLQLGYPENELSRLNRVQLHQQVLFVSDVMDAGGQAIDRKYMSQQLDMQSWSSLTFPKERPSCLDFKLWKAGLLQLPLGSRHSQTRIQGFQGGGHKVWDWRYDEEGGWVLHLKGNGVIDVYTPSLVPGFETHPNCWTGSWTEVRVENCRTVCMVKKINLAVWLVCSYAMSAPTLRTPTNFWEVMQEWGCDWLWKDLQLVGPTEWLPDAIVVVSCIGVMDGSYMQTLQEDICSTAFFFKSSDRSCKLVGAFAESSIMVNAYRGELLGLMALHLILLVVNKVNPGLKGEITLHSDCLGAISRIGDLPPGKMPSTCKHADILKNILIACKRLTFNIVLEHVEAHQDDGRNFTC
jgi:hypothetical protein